MLQTNITHSPNLRICAADDDETDGGAMDGTCVDFEGYMDSSGTSCAQTEEFGNCVDGAPGAVDEEGLRGDANADGISPLLWFR